MKSFDLVGLRFGRLIVISKHQSNKQNRVQWNCICDCGNVNIVTTNLLRSGRTRSCGCYALELKVSLNTTHGFSNNRKDYPEYHVWLGMKARCYNKNNDRYADWGGRGITVCKKWVNDFQTFLSDMGRRPSDKHSIERKDNNNGYSPENCYWATKADQNRNTRANVYYECDGKRMVITDWAKYLCVSRSVIKKHLRTKSFKQVLDYYKNKQSGAWYEKRKHLFLAVQAQ